MNETVLSKISLDAAGLVALADLVAVARRTSLTGTSAWLDCLVLCPGLHRQQDAPKLNAGEYPICAAMTSGYVFRIENQATVSFMQKVGRAGQLTTLSVSLQPEGQSTAVRALRGLYDFQGASFVSTLCYLACTALAAITVALTIYLEDWWALLAIGVLILARLINVLVLRRRAVQGWKGEPEPRLKSDLLVLASLDRWVRIQGDVNDVKAVTSGEWLREPTFVENGAVAFATLIVYLDAALAGNGSTKGKLLLLILLFGSAALLGLANEYTETLKMYDRSIKVSGERKRYQRRLHLAEELIRETGRDDWAVKLDMIGTDALARLKAGVESEQSGGTLQDSEDDSDSASPDEHERPQVIREL